MPPLEYEEEPSAPEEDQPPPLDEAPPAPAPAFIEPGPDAFPVNSERPPKIAGLDGGRSRKTRHQTPKRRRSAKKGRKGLSKKKTGSRK
jgi:hypothetical protein